MKYDGTLKRAFDIAVAVAVIGTAIIPAAVAAVAAAKWIYHRENPFYFDERIGKDGKPFNIIKLKSMRTVYDEDGNLLPPDKRVTKFGKFLRHTALDEIPQFINILKGDMSLVGPRPRSPWEIRNAIAEENLSLLLSVRPGLTGTWQVKTIGTKIDKSARELLDVEYIKSGITFRKDLSYILKTFPAFLKGHDITPPKNNI